MTEQAPEVPTQVRTDISSHTVKTRAACDECRLKKLRCTGEKPKCSRCSREGIHCVYSVQKQMGRPRKRQRTDDDLQDESLRNRRREASPTHTLLDAEPYASAFTPGGSLQPWLQDTINWSNNFDVDRSKSNSSESVPGLTPDSSSNSPPLLNLPPELTQTQQKHRGNSTSLLLDPALSASDNQYDVPPSLLPGCACLSTMYLTLNNLQATSTDPTFPFSLHPLREAMQMASQVLDCSSCPKRFITAIQNTQLLGTLLMSIAERFGKMLEYITAESLRAERAGETKKFRLADLNSPTSHLHVGGLGCVAAFSINLSPEEWKNMCKKVVRAEVHGPADGSECCPYFLAITKKMEDRQAVWHTLPVPQDFPRNENGNLIGNMHANRNLDIHQANSCQEVVAGQCSKNKEEPLCLKMVIFAKALVREFDWS